MTLINIWCLRWREKGQAAVELAIITPILIMLVLISPTLSLTIMARHDVNIAAHAASRAGAEIGILDPAYGQAVGVVQSKARRIIEERGLDPDRLTFSVTSPGSGSYPREGVFGVQLSYQYELPFEPSGFLRFAVGPGGEITHVSESRS